MHGAMGVHVLCLPQITLKSHHKCLLNPSWPDIGAALWPNSLEFKIMGQTLVSILHLLGRCLSGEIRETEVLTSLSPRESLFIGLLSTAPN